MFSSLFSWEEGGAAGFTTTNVVQVCPRCSTEVGVDGSIDEKGLVFQGDNVVGIATLVELLWERPELKERLPAVEEGLRVAKTSDDLEKLKATHSAFAPWIPSSPEKVLTYLKIFGILVATIAVAGPVALNSAQEMYMSVLDQMNQQQASVADDDTRSPTDNAKMTIKPAGTKADKQRNERRNKRRTNRRGH